MSFFFFFFWSAEQKRYTSHGFFDEEEKKIILKTLLYSSYTLRHLSITFIRANRSRITIKFDFWLYFYTWKYFFFTSSPMMENDGRKNSFSHRMFFSFQIMRNRFSLFCSFLCFLFYSFFPLCFTQWLIMLKRNEQKWNILLSAIHKLYEPNRLQANSRMLHTNEFENVNGATHSTAQKEKCRRLTKITNIKWQDTYMNVLTQIHIP